MRVKWQGAVILSTAAILGVLLGGCTPTAPDADLSSVGTDEGCPTPGADTQLLMNERHGYCVLYPAGYEVISPNEDETVLVVGGLLDVEHPRVYIRVTDAGDGTARQVGDELEDQIPPGFVIDRSDILIDGEEAVMLDRLPGQDMNRQVVAVHGGRLFALTFVPVGEDYGELSVQTEAIYARMVDSFRFLP